MSQVNYLEFKEKQLLGSNEIPSKYKHHYTYRITTPCGKHYVGVRSCDCLPVDDLGHKYFGSPTGKDSISLTRNPENKFKVLNTFPTRLLATLSESYYHHNLDVRNRVDFLNLGNANVKGMSSLNYEEVGLKISMALTVVQKSGLTIAQETGLKIGRIMSVIQPSGLTLAQETGLKSAITRALVQPSGLTINQEAAIKSTKTKSIVQPSGLTIFQESGQKSAETKSIVQPSGLTIAQENGIKSHINKSIIQPSGLTIYQEAGLKGVKTKSIIQPSGLTIYQEAGLKVVQTKSTIQPSGLTIFQENSIKAAITMSVVQSNGLTIAQESGIKSAKTKSIIQDSGLSISQEAGLKITGANHPSFKGYYVFNDQKWASGRAMNKELGITNISVKCKTDNLKMISSYAYGQVEFLQSLGTREELVGRTWKDIGFSFEPK